MLTAAQIDQARDRLRGRLPRTPLVPSATLSAELGARVSLKLECLQKTGSFKPRGAFNKMLSLTAEEQARGVVAVSGGNHAQGVAYAARQLGLRAVVCMPRTTPANYLDATRGYGAEVVLTADIHAAFAEAERLRQAGMTLVHPFDDPLVAAGQGTIGREIVEDAPDVTHLFVSIGGGGLLAGVATAVRAARPEAQIIGVETVGADAMAQAWAAGEIVELPAITSIARTLGSPKVSPFTFEAARRLAREVVVVPDAEAVAALVFLLERAKVLTEPAAACVLAAARRWRSAFTPTDHVVLLLCGGNVALADVCGWAASAGR
ncbi:MAG: threonine/serine dehydratase [Gemmataceae bacterium]